MAVPALQVVAGRGNNLHEVKDHLKEHYLVSMPPKFRLYRISLILDLSLDL